MVTQLHIQINRYSMVFYYDIDIHFWILIGYISIYFGDTRDYLDRRCGQSRPPAKTILLVKNVLGLKFSPTSFILALVIKNPCTLLLSTSVWMSDTPNKNSRGSNYKVSYMVGIFQASKSLQHYNICLYITYCRQNFSNFFLYSVNI